jgi:DNA-binding transcriptional regulator/RsmH inhibitor MraZ
MAVKENKSSNENGQPPAKMTLAEMALLLENIKPKCRGFAETDDYDKKTRRICLGAGYNTAFYGLSRWLRVTRAPQGQLVLMACEIWPEYLANTGSVLSTLGCEALAADLERKSERVRLDAKGRVRIPEELAKEAGLKDQVEVFHVGGVIELWNPETYLQHRKEAFARFHERLFSAPAQKSKALEMSPEDACKT